MYHCEATCCLIVWLAGQLVLSILLRKLDCWQTIADYLFLSHSFFYFKAAFSTSDMTEGYSRQQLLRCRCNCTATIWLKVPVYGWNDKIVLSMQLAVPGRQSFTAGTRQLAIHGRHSFMYCRHLAESSSLDVKWQNLLVYTAGGTREAQFNCWQLAEDSSLELKWQNLPVYTAGSTREAQFNCWQLAEGSSLDVKWQNLQVYKDGSTWEAQLYC
jgi:hypothetical protein